VQFLTEITKCVAWHVFNAILHTVVILPPEILIVELVVFVEYFLKSRQVFRFEFASVDVRMRRCVLTVVCSSVGDRDYVVSQNFEKSFQWRSLDKWHFRKTSRICKSTRACRNTADLNYVKSWRGQDKVPHGPHTSTSMNLTSSLM
jgi:hypothetical protein